MIHALNKKLDSMDTKVFPKSMSPKFYDSYYINFVLGLVHFKKLRNLINNLSAYECLGPQITMSVLPNLMFINGLRDVINVRNKKELFLS